MAQEIIVDNASYPTEKIAKNSHDFRPLGLGFANLGALLMSMGIAYDSDQRPRLGRRDHRHHVRPGVSDQRADCRRRRARSPATPQNEEPFLDVIRMHRESVSGIDSHRVPPALFEAREACWQRRL